MRLLLATLLLGLALLAGPAAALEVPPASGYVVDRAGLLQPATRARLEQSLVDLDRSDSTQIAVLTVPSLEGEDLEEFSLRVATAWGIGRKEHDNGALLLVAHQDRRLRIEVGYGLEGQLTDLLTGRIIDNVIVPRFRQGDFEGGIVTGVQAMVDAARGLYQAEPQSRKKQRNPLGLLLLLLFLGPILLRLLGAHGSHHRRGGGFYTGGYGGGFGGGGGGFGGGGGGFSGGGGGFGGGGASGSW